MTDPMIDAMAKAIFIAEHEGSELDVLEAAWAQEDRGNYDFRPKAWKMAQAAVTAMNDFLSRQLLTKYMI